HLRAAAVLRRRDRRSARPRHRDADDLPVAASSRGERDHALHDMIRATPRGGSKCDSAFESGTRFSWSPSARRRPLLVAQPTGSEFRVNTRTTNGQTRPSVAADSAGRLVVVWESYGQDGSKDGVFGRRFFASGSPLGVEFQVNTTTTDSQSSPSV